MMNEMPSADTIMLVEDDGDIREAVALLLKNRGYRVLQAENSVEAMSLLIDDVDLFILDVMLPGASGIELCRDLRRTTNAPILFLTARSSDADKEEGLLAGGDDYLTKPFSEKELMARVTALTRRYQVYRGKQVVEGETYLVSGDLKVSEQFNAVWKDGQQIELTDIEYRILRLLMKNRNRIYPIKTIYESIWEEPYYYSSNNTVMVHIRKLRKKIEDDPQKPVYIRTEWGRGYKFSG